MGVNCHEFVVIKLRASNFSIFGTKIDKIGGDKGNVLVVVGFSLAPFPGQNEIPCLYDVRKDILVN